MTSIMRNMFPGGLLGGFATQTLGKRGIEHRIGYKQTKSRTYIPEKRFDMVGGYERRLQQPRAVAEKRRDELVN